MGKSLSELAQELEQQFRHWEQLRDHGGSDPFWSDGVNMNLVRNQIRSTKKQIMELVEAGNNEVTLFPDVYPDIWYKETPSEMPTDYMARADEIRTHAREQLQLYLADPNFQYLKGHATEAYSQGRTRETKEAGLPYYGAIGLEHYEKEVANDDLVSMRRSFHEPYETKAVRWAQFARHLQAYLEGERGPYALVAGTNSPDSKETIVAAHKESQFDKLSPPFDTVLSNAVSRARAQKAPEPVKRIDDQLTLF